MSATSSTHTVRQLLSIFARHGLPEELFTDNGPQFSAREFSEFTSRYKIRHNTSSPYFPQANGMAERAVKTIKALMRSSPDLNTALLAYRSTPLEHGYSPAQLLFGRRLRTTVPMTSEQQRPTLPDTKHFQDKDADLKLRQQSNHDDRHLARRLSPLPEGSPVFLPDRRETGHIVSQPACRSYVVSTPSGEFRRNRRHINQLPLTDPVDDTEPPETQAQCDRETDDPPTAPSLATSQEQAPASSPVTVTRSGRVVRPPSKLDC